ncbi:hypothetical protein SPRG_09520 [Saprolegnia parasitica CBS 223.65]|uniref:Uncharacterized protein n=1 Tax=Saprolegnia parasitica (strain CBS 223.65) TaxID=695850 RepID=A0A067C6S9_SAPPC|nr:hypothetical protein SPRG_09520 [Saprolegnia parasitica CBS 223.65]KDO24875.1 hypothetical protein SPRG_09520 [Saprolegnia parasitica CBS 223.65]|eukprot:XP_012204336.1 hypothetical protein SPRG_09520 [Saprolegnia parasitica CBS 223.65]
MLPRVVGGLYAAVAAVLLLSAPGLRVLGDRIPLRPYSSCRIIVDAGSSGTRFFAFPSPSVPAADTFAHLTPGLSEIAPLQAYAYMRQALYEVQASLAPEMRSRCFVHIYGTAGMRGLEASQQAELYNQLYLDLKNDATMALPLERVHVRTISGDDEAFFLAMAANYLDARVESDLAPSNVDLFGALDLGGGSTQIVFDVKERWRQNARRKAMPHQKTLNASEFFLHSFANYGTRHMHDQVLQSIVANASTNHSANATTSVEMLANPCYFTGYTSGNQTGTGHAAECLDLLQSLVAQENANCPSGSFCALQSVPQPPVTGAFYAVSVYYLATVFARDVVSRIAPTLSYGWPAPSLEEIEAATHLVCNTRFDELATFELKHTPKEMLPRRCLDLCYVTTLLRAYGFGLSERRVVFVDRIRGSPLVWATGAYLMDHALASTAYAEALVSYLSRQVEVGLPIGWHVALLMLTMAVFALVLTVHRATGRHGSTQAIEFVGDPRK